MNRRDFLRATLLGSAAVAVASSPIELFAAKDKSKKKSKQPLRISFQEGTAPGKTLGDKLDYMEANGVVGFEPGGKGLSGRVAEINKLLSGRNIKVSAICAGFDGFILSQDAATRKIFDVTMKEIIEAAGAIGSVGVIMVPAFNHQVPVLPHTADTRAYLIEQLQLLGDHALKNNTTIILEPLNRKEAFYLRQVADAASICRDANHDGVRCMGDFWHMTTEEPSDYGAFFSGGKYLQHVHIASRGTRNMPGEDGEVDNYVDGFRALKEMNYPGFVSFECGCKTNREEAVPTALKLMREQWEKA